MAATRGAGDAVSLGHLVRRFWRLTALTWVLVLLEGLCLVALPLVIGRAVDGLMNERVTGVVELTVLCGVLLLVGAGRRVFDTRAYARIHRTVAGELVVHEKRRQASLSEISARTHLFTELIEFLEESIPSVLLQLINLAGTLVIIALIDLEVFLACLASIVFAALVYSLSEERIFRINAGANDELERQVEILAATSEREIPPHFKRLMGWRIKLSDLETLNFSVIWAALTLLLIFTVVVVTTTADLSFGRIVSAVMYVFGFIESVLILPLYYQQLVRLREITQRLARVEPPRRDPSEDDAR
ncbi:MAG: ABC transporter six-transmembrane domain-containing protein [Acidobacteriota bacterium]